MSDAIKKAQRELRVMAENIPFRQVDLPEPCRAPAFVPRKVRQKRTFVRADSNMQAIGRFLVERGTVELLPPEDTHALFTEIHWCAATLRDYADRDYGSDAEWRQALILARGLVSEMEAAEEELFIANRRLVVSCVKPFFWIGQVWLSDFLQEGSKALSNAIRKFDFTRGTPFYAYAQKSIQNRLRNYFRDHVRSGSIGMRPSKDMLRVKQVVDAWIHVHDKEPDNETLAQMTGMPKSRIVQVKGFIKQWESVPSPPISLDALMGDSTANLYDLVEDREADVASEVTQISEIWEAMSILPERSRKIMKMRFIEGRTLEETGAALSLTRARIKQIQDESLSKLREALRDRSHSA